ncbi:hypothetical protein [Methylorubrum extorquens]
MSAPSAYDAEFMDRFDGLYVAMLDPDELGAFAELCRRGLMHRSYAHPSGLLGLARIERVPASPLPSSSPDQHKRPKV